VDITAVSAALLGSWVQRPHITGVAVSRETRKRAIERVRKQEARRRLRRQLLIAASGLAVAGGIAAAIVATTAGGSAADRRPPAGKFASLATLGTLQPAPAAGATGPEGVPVPSGAPLTSTTTAASGQAVDGISCGTSEQTLFHIHAHVTVIVNGTARQIPYGIGIPAAVTTSTQVGPYVGSGKCFYWLHTHAGDGIIHIESPVHRTFTLGNFFDEWGQPLGPDQVGPASGHVTAIDNGKVYRGNPRDIPLTAHAQIQLEVGTPLVAPESISFPSNL
jgi:hypothetical protein